MNMFKATDAKTPEQYIEMIEEPRRSEIKKLHELIVSKAPGFKPYIEMGMIGYGRYRYKYASGKEGYWAVIGLASQKNYISLYICVVDEDGKYVAEEYKQKLPKANIGKSCIRFKVTKDVDMKVLEEIIKKAAKLGGMGKVKE